MTKKLLGVLAIATMLLAGGAYAQSQGVTSLRGAVELDDSSPAPTNLKQAKPSTGFGRAYRQQPPLVPHRVDNYQVTKEFNKCMSCHSWPKNAQYGAPKVSETHYETRDGQPLDTVSPRRWFCTQCHVPQADAPALVPNAFKNASEVGGAFSQ
ncbi:nitrate reductase cytochrome c-type subunit [Rhodovibrionaceae bacterium A322]